MSSTRSRFADRHLAVPPATGRQLTGDILLAAGLLALVLVVNLSGVESVPANSDPSVLSVALTVLAVGPLAVRRRYPLTVLVVSLLGILGLVILKATVGLAPLALFIAAYTAVAMSTRRNARLATLTVVAGLALTAVLSPVDLSPEGVVFNLIVFGGALLLAQSTRARRDRALADVAAAEQRAEAERERAAHSIAEERLEITRELHDVVGHAMSVMVVQAGVAERLLDRDLEQAREAVSEIAKTGRRSMAEMRQILGMLRDGSTDGQISRSPMPTLDDLHTLAGEFARTGLPVEVEVVGNRQEIPAGIDLAAYRVVQEALTNCLKHARASQATVTLTYRTAAVEIEVVDDGGTTASDQDGSTSAGHGLIGMRERVAIYAGELSVGPMVGGGFRVHATFPFTQQIPRVPEVVR